MINFPRMKIFIKYLSLTVLTMVICFSAIGQQLTVNTKKIELLINQWNLIHNNANVEGFENIYDDQLLFYSEHVSRSKATLLKKLLFVRNPGYQQKITTDIKYTLHTNGVVKCEFTKEVLQAGEWDREPMYLLVGFKNHGYWIIGESDFATDKENNYKPKIGEALDVEILSASIPAENNTVLSEMPVRTSISTPSGVSESISYGGLHIFLVIALLSAGVLIIFLDRMGVKKEKARQAQQDEEVMLEDDFETVILEAKMPNEAYQVIENSLKQKAFRDYLLKQFDPVFFTLKPSENGQAFKADVNPQLTLEFNLTEKSKIPAITVQYLYKEDNGNDLVISPEDQILFSQDRHDLYYVIGVGGPPDVPSEIYLIPAGQIKSNTLSKDDLKPFRRSGSFYFDTISCRLM
jgi:hypothetical protein